MVDKQEEYLLQSSSISPLKIELLHKLAQYLLLGKVAVYLLQSSKISTVQTSTISTPKGLTRSISTTD